MRTYSADEIARGGRFAWAFHRKLRAYLRQPFYCGAFGRAGPQPSDSNFVHYVLAAALADQLAVPYDEYVEAHFWAEHRRRGRHPQARHLHLERGYSAEQRVTAWRAARAAEPTAPVISPARRERPPQTERFATQERYLRQLCAQWGVEADDILRAFGHPDLGMFDPRWLRTLPSWRALREADHFAGDPGPDLEYLARRRDELASRRGGP